MPTLYRGICSQCQFETPIMTSHYGAIWIGSLVDRPPQSAIVGAVILRPSRSQLAADDDPRFLILAHPAERAILDSTGLSWSDVDRKGRFVSVTNVICQQCGTVFPR